jgi:hypothetical protein
LRYFLFVRARRIANERTVNKIFSEDTMDADAPGLESYDGRGINVDYQGENQLSHYGDVGKMREVREA